MKRRNREINIFNMSLLDVLCGALGAFCFLMLVLLPYYDPNPAKSKAPEVPPGVDPKTYEEAMARIKELDEALKKFQKYAQELEEQNKQLEARNKQLENQLKDSKEASGQFEMRNPVIAIGRFVGSPTDEFEMYIESDRSTADGRRDRKVDPNVAQGTFFTGDFNVHGAGAGLGYFMV